VFYVDIANTGEVPLDGEAWAAATAGFRGLFDGVDGVQFWENGVGIITRILIFRAQQQGFQDDLIALRSTHGLEPIRWAEQDAAEFL
jgi:hypothetical protein